MYVVPNWLQTQKPHHNKYLINFFIASVGVVETILLLESVYIFAVFYIPYALSIFLVYFNCGLLNELTFRYLFKVKMDILIGQRVTCHSQTDWTNLLIYIISN